MIYCNYLLYLKDFRINRSINLKKFILKLTLIFTVITVIHGCANQLPPGGGEEDKTPPKVKIISPKPNETNYSGNSISFEFNEYIDRRSFQDAFHTSPQVKGELEFNWGAKDVEVIFPKEFDKIDPNKTFVVTVNTSFKDIRGNSVNEPVSFAFSTGSRIDMSSVTGRVYNAENKTVSILAYNMKSNYNPTENLPDYAVETGPEGNYSLTNLAAGSYRIIAIIDDDRNLLYTGDRESYGVLPADIDIADSINIPNINFNLKILETAPAVQPELDITKYFKDSLGIISTSIKPGTQSVLPEQSIFISFNRNKPTRDEIINGLEITDEDNSPERMVFNWKNDSLVEIFAQNRFKSNKKYMLSLTAKDDSARIYRYSMQFRTVSVNSFGELKGNINYNSISPEDYLTRIELRAEKIIPVLKYNFEVRDTVFIFKNIFDASYKLFAYIDKNNNGVFDYGSPYPYEPAEPFVFYPSLIGIKGGWTVENVNINFAK